MPPGALIMPSIVTKARKLHKCFVVLVIAVCAFLVVWTVLRALPSFPKWQAFENRLGTMLEQNESTSFAKGFVETVVAETVTHRTARKGKEKELSGAQPCEPKERGDVIHVVISGDNNTFPGIVTLAASIKLNTRSTVMFHLMTFDTQAGQLRSILQSSIIHNTSYQIITFPKDALKGQFKVRAPRKDLANPLNFIRNYLPDLLPCVDTMVYIDTDCLVLGDIKQLYNWHIKDQHVVAMFPKNGTAASSLLNFNHPLVRKLGIQRDTTVPQAGVFVANLTRWRQRNITAQLDNWMKTNVKSEVVRYSGGGAGSQSIFLLVFYNKYTPFGESWNKRLWGRQHEKTDNLLHWNANPKPWFPTNKKIKERELWLDYFKKSRANLTLRLNN